MPKSVLLWRLSSIREIVLSGFQLEFYSPEEKTFAYWYLTRVFETELECYDSLLSTIPSGSSPIFHVESFLISLRRYACIS